MASLEKEAFWKHVAPQDMTLAQWESLCDGCGKCCMHKLEDEDTGELYFTVVACRHLDLDRCRCKVYEERFRHVPECLKLGPQMMNDVAFLPSTCAYRLVGEGRDLPAWHPLVCGDANAIHAAQVSVRDKAISEDAVSEEQIELYIVDTL